MKLIFKLSIITLLFFSFNLPVSAQVPASIDGVNIKTSTDSPRPGQSIEVSVESFNFDLNSSSIVWIVDGKTVNQGVGLTKINIVGPKIGVPANISAIIKTPEGREINKSIIIKSGSIDIIWESYGYVPPFFKGKSSFAYQNKLRLIAVPHLSKDGINEIDPKTLVYSWKRGGKYIEGGQGYGKQTVDILPDELPKTLDVSVEVYDREQTQNTVGYITLTPSEPSITFYEIDPLYGIFFNKSLESKVSLKNNEIRVLASPFGFSVDNNPLTYSWSINNIEQAELAKNQSIVLRTKGDSEGSSNINLEVRNLRDILQGARSELTIYFTKKEQVTEENNSIF